jgi:hypothetical protein
MPEFALLINHRTRGRSKVVTLSPMDFKGCSLHVKATTKFLQTMTKRVSAATASGQFQSATRMRRSHDWAFHQRQIAETAGDFVLCISKTVQAVAIFEQGEHRRVR